MLEKLTLVDFLFDTVDRKRNLKNLFLSYTLGIPLNVYRCRSRQLKRQVEQIAHHYDVILIDHYESAQYLPIGYHGTVLLHAHNAMHVLWRRYADTTNSLLHKLAARMESWRVEIAEQRICTRSDAIFASPNDLEALAKLNGARHKFFPTAHAGDSKDLERPQLTWAKNKNVLLYVGTLSWEANVDGLIWFVREVFPPLSAAHPELRLKVVGKEPDLRLRQAVNGIAQISLEGYQEDLEPYYQEACISIAPVRFGAGMKVKVLSAMARGLPVVTTSVGAEGIDVKNQEHLMVADTPTQWIMSITGLLKDQIQWSQMSKKSRKKINEKYTWPVIFENLQKKIDDS